MNNDQQLSWVAGLLEGEGCFIKYAIKSSKYITSAVTLEMTDEDIIKRYKSYINNLGIITTTKTLRRHRSINLKPSYCLRVNGFKANKLMKLVLPFMGKRRSNKIKEILNETNI